MKKMITAVLSGLVLLGCLAGCGAQPTQAPVEKDRDSRTSSEFSQAYESDKGLSAEEKEKQENSRRKDIEEKYSIYQEFGMEYDKNKDRFFYNGKMVRYFSDPITSNDTNGFCYKEGAIDVEPVRDESGKLTGLKQASDADYATRTEKLNKVEVQQQFQGASTADSQAAQEIGNPESTNIQGSYELGDPNIPDTSLDAYKNYGVSYDIHARQWVYDQRPIHLLYDAKVITFVDNAAVNGINLKVIRDAKGNIGKLTEMADSEIPDILNE